MKNIQNLGGFVLTSQPYNRGGSSEDLFLQPGSNASVILKYDYCIPPDNADAVKQDRKKIVQAESTVIMKKRSNAA